MMRPCTLILATSLLTCLTEAGRTRAPKKEVTITTKHRDSVPVLDGPAAPAVPSTTPNKERDTNALTERDYYLTCLIPHQGQEPDMDDCFAVCEFLTENNPLIEVPPDDMVTVQSGVCEFTMLNIGCFWHSFTGQSVYPACRQMLTNCVYNGHDGLLSDEDHDIAYSISGSEAAPPYQHPSCPAS